ncbi:MAG TPA: excinuclease ABC subunit UvrC [Thermomicrobiales bacterium]|nr:excinuclease ABC subunit UvrC [Thermomicrobiales bacterium]
MNTNARSGRPDFSSRLAALALAPGVYLMKDDTGTIIYVGKAAALRNRVRSYFQSERGKDPKTRELVRHIVDFDVIRTDTAAEALILENELIKKYQPKYNVLLKDSKTYPYLKITNEEWPRVIITRRVTDDGGRYFGPYTSAGQMHKTLHLINRLFTYRKCDKKITGNDEVCLYYHMHQCTAPCISAVDRPTYMQSVESAALFLSGRGDKIVAPLQDEMHQAADAWNFERAAELRDRIDAVNHVLERQKIVSTNGLNADVLAVAQGPGGDAGVQAGFLRNGKILGSEFFPVRATLEDQPDGILASFVTQFYIDAAVVPPLLLLEHPLPDNEADVIIPWLRDRRGGKVEVIHPQRGERRKLVEMIARSASENLEQSRLKFLSDEMKTTAALTELSDALDLPRMPRRIECYDISNLQGTNSVASMVVFEDGKPAKREYRRFTIKTVEGANDFASMNEVLQRRFRRAGATGGDDTVTVDAEAEAGDTPSPDGKTKDDGKWTKLPDLVIVDGGKGQLSSAVEALEAVGWTGQAIAGLAKENEELFLPGRPDPILLPRDSQALYLIQRIRDEAHRFAITFHRQKRSKTTIGSSLDNVPGIGPKRKKALIKRFGSVRGIREASEDEIATVEGITTALAAQIKSSL